jgi:hypothetical protein
MEYLKITGGTTNTLMFIRTGEAKRGTEWWKIEIWRLRALGETVN